MQTESDVCISKIPVMRCRRGIGGGRMKSSPAGEMLIL